MRGCFRGGPRRLRGTVVAIVFYELRCCVMLLGGRRGVTSRYLSCEVGLTREFTIAKRRLAIVSVQGYLFTCGTSFCTVCGGRVDITIAPVWGLYFRGRRGRVIRSHYLAILLDGVGLLVQLTAVAPSVRSF